MRATTAISFYSAPAPETFSPPPPGNSPVPYLFGGLAAMLGLIAFALLLLAYSYLLGGDAESSAAEKGGGSSGAEASPVSEEKFLVIMAGDINPTFLATPTSGRADGKIKEAENTYSKNQIDLIIPENGQGFHLIIPENGQGFQE